MKFTKALLIVILSVAVTFAILTFINKSSSAQIPAKETAYQRVLRTGTLKCGYIIYPRFFERDPNTGAYSGLDYELINEVGRQLGLKVEWAQEIGMADMFEGLNTRKYDAVCSTIAIVPNRLKAAEFTIPYVYFPFFLYSRAGDTRFDKNFAKINDPKVKVAYLEGEMGQIVKEQDFPKATSLALQNLTGFADVPLQVATGKADIAMGEPAEVDAFMEKNPGKIRQVIGPPIRMQAMTLQVAIGEESLRDLLSGTLFFLQNSGFVAHLFEKYLGKPGHYYFLPNSAWRVEESSKP